MTNNTRRVLPLLGASLLAIAAASVTSGAAVATPLPARPAPASNVPLSKVGLGWSIAEVSSAPVPTTHATKGKTTLYAVSPQGRKFAFYSWPSERRERPATTSSTGLATVSGYS